MLEKNVGKLGAGVGAGVGATAGVLGGKVVIASSGAVIGTSGAGIMSGLAAIGSIVGGSALTGVFVIAGGVAVATIGGAVLGNTIYKKLTK